MNCRRLLAVARKEAIQIQRDPRSLVIVLMMPLILVLLFGYGVSLDLKHLPVCVYDREGSQQSQDLLKHFQASEYFHIIRAANSYPQLVESIDRGEAKIGIVIPWDFSGRLHNGQNVPIQAIVDATDDNTANVIIGYAQAVVQGYSAGVLSDWSERLGRGSPAPPISIEARTWFNENLESRAFILPGVLALVMAVIGAFLTSLTIAREWERGTMEQLVSTPVTPLEILFGKLLPYFVMGMVAALICALMAILWFQVPFRGSFMTLLASTALFLVVVLSIGFFVSVVAKNQLAASQMALMIAFLPSFLLSGFLFSIEQMPKPIQVVTHIVPARYYTTILKDIFLKGTPALMLYGQLLPLAIFSVALALIATRAFHKRLA
ncbi:MAG TPA: ABC transporter permease [Verrucomicrobiae bacterium]|jgi:ABC-2 type transport system permease protein|nr:ABC transporter permease [Verrucomicrobiae bacterium]